MDYDKNLKLDVSERNLLSKQIQNTPRHKRIGSDYILYPMERKINSNITSPQNRQDKQIWEKHFGYKNNFF